MKGDDAMAKTMSPSEPITKGQIAEIEEKVGAALRESGLQSGLVQKVLTTKGQCDPMIVEIVAVVRKCVDVFSKMIVRIVENVDRTIDPQKMIDATGRKQYTTSDVVKSMPRGTGDRFEVVFFKPEPEEYTSPGYMSGDDLEKAFARRGLIAIDPYSLAAFNKTNPAFADDKPNGTHWKDADSKWCYAAFRRWVDGRGVLVCRDDNDWGGIWWFAGIADPKIAKPSLKA
jgi:hypothetical protein